MLYNAFITLYVFHIKIQICLLKYLNYIVEIIFKIAVCWHTNVKNVLIMRFKTLKHTLEIRLLCFRLFFSNVLSVFLFYISVIWFLSEIVMLNRRFYSVTGE